MTVVKFDLGENRSLDGGSGALGSAIVRGAKRESKDECWGGVRNRREAEEGGGGRSRPLLTRSAKCKLLFMGPAAMIYRRGCRNAIALYGPGCIRTRGSWLARASKPTSVVVARPYNSGVC